MPSQPEKAAAEEQISAEIEEISAQIQAGNPPATATPRPALDREDGLESSSDGGTTRFLARLLRLTPFQDLFDRADRDWPKTRGFCFFLDMALRGIVLLVILCIVAAVAWKALAPLPPLWTPSD